MEGWPLLELPSTPEQPSPLVHTPFEVADTTHYETPIEEHIGLPPRTNYANYVPSVRKRKNSDSSAAVKKTKKVAVAPKDPAADKPKPARRNDTATRRSREQKASTDLRALCGQLVANKPLDLDELTGDELVAAAARGISKSEFSSQFRAVYTRVLGQPLKGQHIWPGRMAKRVLPSLLTDDIVALCDEVEPVALPACYAIAPSTA